MYAKRSALNAPRFFKMLHSSTVHSTTCSVAIIIRQQTYSLFKLLIYSFHVRQHIMQSTGRPTWFERPASIATIEGMIMSNPFILHSHVQRWHGCSSCLPLRAMTWIKLKFHAIPLAREVHHSLHTSSYIRLQCRKKARGNHTCARRKRTNRRMAPAAG